MKKNKILKEIFLFASPCLCAIPSLGFISSCNQQTIEEPTENELEKKYNDYAEKYQSEFINNITEQYHDFYRSPDLFCHSEAEGVVMWTYAPGFDVWGTQFHLGKTEEEIASMPDVKTRIGIPHYSAPKDLGQHIERDNLDFHMYDFHYLDEALKRSTAGIDITVYHGYEYNEVEMIEAINRYLGTSDILNMPAEEAATIDVTKLVGKNIKDLCWCATTFEETFAKDWANGSDKINVPVYKMNIASNVNCAYVSYSRKTRFDGIYLAWPYEYQLLTQRNLNLLITKASWEKRPDNKGNFLVIECDATK